MMGAILFALVVAYVAFVSWASVDAPPEGDSR